MSFSTTAEKDSVKYVVGNLGSEKKIVVNRLKGVEYWVCAHNIIIYTPIYRVIILLEITKKIITVVWFALIYFFLHDSTSALLFVHLKYFRQITVLENRYW